MATTENYGFKLLGPGDKLSDDDYKFGSADRELLDKLLQSFATHHHSGAAAGTGTIVSPPTLTLHSSGGDIPAGTRVFYKVALVDPSGFEQAASPEAYVDTAPAISPPGAAAIELLATGGSLLPGVYYYVLTAYYPLNTQETTAGMPQFTHIRSGATNAITLHFPSPPTGAAGYNVYRQRPGGTGYHYLTSIPITGGATPANWTDDGTVVEDPDRRPPSTNITQSANSVDVALPAANTPLAAGWTWKVYRTYLASSYGNSFLYHVVEETAMGSGIITTTYTDVGAGTLPGSPSDRGTSEAAPGKVNLAGMSEVTGRLPLAGLEAVPVSVTFAQGGAVVAQPGKHIWVCEYTRARIVGIRVVLGVGSTPGTQPLIVDINHGTGTNPTFTSIFASPASRPQIAVGAHMSSLVVPVVGTDFVDLVAGDSMTIDVDQTDAAAANMTVTVRLLAQFDRATSDLGWS